MKRIARLISIGLIIVCTVSGCANPSFGGQETDASSVPPSSETSSERNADGDYSEIISPPTEDETEESQTATVVYFTSDISSEGLVKLYHALSWNPGENVAVKVSTGEPPASNYLRTELIGDLVQIIDGTIVECNTAYGGSRASSAMHRQVAEDHGFTAIADFDLLDEDGETE